MNARFDAALFDVGGVLVVPDPLPIGAVLEEFGGTTSVGRLIEAHYRGMHAQDTAGQVHDDWDAYRHGYVLAAGVDRSRVAAAMEALAGIWSHFLWRFPLHAGIAGLWQLHRAGLPIGLVSNASGQISGMLASSQVAQVGPGGGVPVRVIVDSEIVGVAKPDPAVFAPALAALGVDPERCLYVGDSIANDVVGARAAGLHPLLLDPYGLHGGSPHERITRLAEVMARC